MYLLSPIDYRLYNIELAIILHYSKYRTDWRQRTLETILRSETILWWPDTDLCYFLVRAKLRYQQRLIRHLDLQRFSFYGLGSYLILIGHYLLALSVSEDDELRNYIKKSALQESKFLHSIGSSSLAEREREVMTRVLSNNNRCWQRILEESPLLLKRNQRICEDRRESWRE